MFIYLLKGICLAAALILLYCIVNFQLLEDLVRNCIICDIVIDL